MKNKVYSNTYFDTNALIKYFRNEGGTANVRNIVNALRAPAPVGQIAIVEFVSVILKLYRKKFVKRKHVKLILRTLIELTSGPNRRLAILPQDNRALKAAAGILIRNGFTSGIGSIDSIHLANAKLLGASMIFVTSDRALINTCASEGARHYNPEECKLCCKKALL